jgi:hypothetical protein
LEASYYRGVRLPIVVILLTAAFATPTLARGSAGEDSGTRATNPRVGGSVVVRSRIYRSTAKITLVRVIDPAKPSYPSKLRPRRGDRWIAIRIRIRGVRGSWIDAPSSDGRLVDVHRHTVRALPAGYGTVEPRMPGTTDLSPGQAVVGNLVFELPRNARVRKFIYGVHEGSRATWSLAPTSAS